MKYCAYCLKEVDDDIGDCPSCGSEITNQKLDKLPEVVEISKEVKPKVKKGK
jgi:uncharacterized membrane protein YvbJ